MVHTIQVIDQILRDTDIALKQGHNDVTILTPSAIAIEVSWNFVSSCYGLAELAFTTKLTGIFLLQPFQALLKMESVLSENAMVRNWPLVAGEKDTDNIKPFFIYCTYTFAWTPFTVLLGCSRNMKEDHLSLYLCKL